MNEVTEIHEIAIAIMCLMSIVYFFLKLREDRFPKALFKFFIAFAMVNGVIVVMAFASSIELVVGVITGVIANGTVADVQALCDQNKAHLYGDGTGQQLVFATDTVGADRLEASAWVGANNQQKPINSKDRKGYIGNEGTYNAGYNYRVYDLNTNTLSRTVTRPLQNSGEENFDMGQEHQYCMGMYDGAQNNRGHKFFYTTDTGYELGAGSVRTGIPGGSSGICGWKG